MLRTKLFVDKELVPHFPARKFPKNIRAMFKGTDGIYSYYDDGKLQKNKEKHILRMIIFALISQLPFLSESYITNLEIDEMMGLVTRVNVLGEGKLGAFILGENASSNLLDTAILDSLILG